MAPRKRTRPTLQELLAEHEAKQNWERVDPEELQRWAQLSDREGLAYWREEHERELDR